MWRRRKKSLVFPFKGEIIPFKDIHTVQIITPSVFSSSIDIVRYRSLKELVTTLYVTLFLLEYLNTLNESKAKFEFTNRILSKDLCKAGAMVFGRHFVDMKLKSHL